MKQVSSIKSCAAAAAQAQSGGMGHGDTADHRQTSISNQHGGGQLPAPRALECSDDGARGECAATINSNQSTNAVHDEEDEEDEEEVRGHSVRIKRGILTAFSALPNLPHCAWLADGLVGRLAGVRVLVCAYAPPSSLSHARMHGRTHGGQMAPTCLSPPVFFCARALDLSIKCVVVSLRFLVVTLPANPLPTTHYSLLHHYSIYCFQFSSSPHFSPAGPLLVP